MYRNDWIVKVDGVIVARRTSRDDARRAAALIAKDRRTFGPGPGGVEVIKGVKRAAKLVVTAAWTQRGWSRDDHWIDDGPISGMVGRSYHTLDAMTKAAQKLCDHRGWPSVEFVGRDGRRYLYDGSPQGIPGREAPAISLVGGAS